jgi:hypothetical protein
MSCDSYGINYDLQLTAKFIINTINGFGKFLPTHYSDQPVGNLFELSVSQKNFNLAAGY